MGGRSGHCWVGLMALVNKYKQCGNIIISVPEMPAHCFALLRSSGAFFEREKYILGSGDLITHIGPLSAPWAGAVIWIVADGLDYDFPIRKLLPFRDVSIARAWACFWARVLIAKNWSISN